MGRDMLAVKGIVFDHHPTLIGPYTSLGGVFQGPFYYYLLAIPTAITGGDPWGPLALMLIISITTAVVAFYFLKKHFGFVPALIGFFLFAVCPEAIAAATYTWNPHPMWLLIVCYIFIIFEIHLKKTKLHLVLWPLIGLMFHFEAALGFFILIITATYCCFALRKKVFSKYFFIGIFLLFLTFVPQILFELRHQFLMTHSVIAMFAGKDHGLRVKGEDVSTLQMLQNHIDALYNNYLTSFPKFPYFPSLPLVGLIGTAAAWYYTRKSKQLQNYTIYFKFYFAFLGLFLLSTSLYQYPIRYWFLTGFQSFYLIATALTLSLLWKYKFGKLFILCLSLLVLTHVSQRLYTLYLDPPDLGGTAKIKGKVDAIDSIYRDANGKEFGLLVFTPPVLTDAYDYLIWWRAKVNHRPIPPKEKLQTFYLLMEPDGANPGSHIGWMETVIKTGAIQKTVTLPSGFIIQKRNEIKSVK